jgi:hypothetical protein
LKLKNHSEIILKNLSFKNLSELLLRKILFKSTKKKWLTSILLRFSSSEIILDLASSEGNPIKLNISDTFKSQVSEKLSK